MKKLIPVILAVLMIASVTVLASCGGGDTVTTDAITDKPFSDTEADTTESSTPSTVEDVTVPDVTMVYVPADVYADAATAEAAGLKAADNTNLSKWFSEKTEFDPETWEIKMPEGFTKVDSYVLRIAQGQYIMEVSVLKVKDAADIEEVRAMADYRREKQKNNGDFKLYDDDKGTNAKMIDTGKVSVFGNFVVYAVTDNTEVSMLRAQSYVASNPDCSALELYRAIVSEITD